VLKTQRLELFTKKEKKEKERHTHTHREREREIEREKREEEKREIPSPRCSELLHMVEPGPATLRNPRGGLRGARERRAFAVWKKLRYWSRDSVASTSNE